MARKPVKRVKNAVLYDDGFIKVMNVRFSHPHLKKAYKGKNDQGEPKFSVTGIMPKDTHKEAKKLIDGEIERILKEKKVKSLASDKKFLRDGDDSGKEEYEDAWTISVREAQRPSCRDENKEIVEQEDIDEVFYGGCYGSILLEPWWQDNDFGKRVNASLRAVRKSKDGESFGKGRISDEEVDEAFDDDEDEDEAPRRSSGRASSKGKNRHEDEDDDEDEKPRRRRSRDDDDDEDEKPKRRRSRDEDDDEDEKPRRRRRPRDEDDDDDL